jgi:DNA-binding IclR family transcriptional regulator
MAKSLDPKRIKSAQRALEVLEFFSLERPTATVMDIARDLGYPQSSTSELLSCLVALGYLDRAADGRTYRPTARVAVIGAATQPDLFRKGRLITLLDHLAEETGVTVTLAHKVGMEMQFVHMVSGEHGRGPEHANAHLATSAPGKAVLSTLPPSLVRRLVHRMNAENEHSHICASDLAEELIPICGRKYVLVEEREHVTVSMLISHCRNEAFPHPLVLSLHAEASFFAEHRDWLLQMMRGAIARLTNPVARTPILPNVAAEPERRYA